MVIVYLVAGCAAIVLWVSVSTFCFTRWDLNNQNRHSTPGPAMLAALWPIALPALIITSPIWGSVWIGDLIGKLIAKRFDPDELDQSGD